MTMPEDSFPPENDPRLEYTRGKDAEELLETANLHELIAGLHIMHEVAEETDAHSASINSRIAQYALTTGTERFVFYGDDEQVAPVIYDEMIWVPREDRQTLSSFGVQAAFVRFPRVKGEDVGLTEDGQDQPIDVNDVFVEIVAKNGDAHRYLVNTNGIEAYTDADSVEFDESDIFDPSRDPSTRPNVFTIAHGSRSELPIAPDALKQILIGDCIMARRRSPSE